MDFNLKQWRKSEVEEETPTLYLDSASSSDHSTCALPLFVSEPLTKLSDSTATAAPPKFPRMGSNYFSLEQLQELELQALIYRHFIAGAPVPPELLHLVKKSIINSTPSYYFPHPFQQYPHYQVQQALMQSGYWGRAAMDPEPGRCRRTDGKKWRCSRDVVAGQKYCERHVHRGRSRSRKPVEIPTPANSVKQMNNSHSNLGKMPCHASTTTPHFSLSGPSPSNDLLHLNQRPYESMKGPLEARKDDGKSSGQILRHFFDDWPRQGGNGGSSSNSVAPATDFSLKLSTGNDYDPGVNVERSTWGTNHVGSMGGPLAEALRSSTTNSSPTSVLHQLPHCNIIT